MINTIGIGSPDGSPIFDPTTGESKKDEQGNVVISKLNEAELQQLADATNGQYLRLDNVDDALITMTQQLDSAEKKAMNDAEFIDYKSYFQYFLATAILLLLAEFFLAERSREKKAGAAALKRTPAPSHIAALLLLITLSAARTASAQNANPDIRSGNRYYKQQQLDKSIQQYQSAVKKAPANPTANYNLGNAQFRKNDYDQAAKAYDATITNSQDKALKEKGYYNKGVAMVKQKKLQESIDAWKQALKLNTDDTEARENLEKALSQQKQQQQQQQKDQQKDQKDQKDKKDEKKNQDQQQQQQQQQQEQPKPQPSRLNKQQVEQLLKALEQKEKDLQNKMQQNKVRTPNQPDKDW
jgi:Ca-activated chloride channel family protein